jgi:hypothetical protein
MVTAPPARPPKLRCSLSQISPVASSEETLCWMWPDIRVKDSLAPRNRMAPCAREHPRPPPSTPPQGRDSRMGVQTIITLLLMAVGMRRRDPRAGPRPLGPVSDVRDADQGTRYALHPLHLSSWVPCAGAGASARPAQTATCHVGCNHVRPLATCTNAVGE